MQRRPNGESKLSEMRAERMARNAAMLELVVGAANDLAEAVGTDAHQRGKARERAAKELEKRLREEAERAGPRKSLRTATRTASQRIARAFVDSGSESESGSGLSLSTTLPQKTNCYNYLKLCIFRDFGV